MAPGRDRFLSSYLPYVLRRADQTLSAPFYTVLNRHGVARSEWRVLAVLHDLGSMSVVELAEAALSPQPTITHAVRRLEERGLVTRTAAEDDKRRRIVSITESGEALTSLLIAQARTLAAEALADVDGVRDLIAQLAALTASIEARLTANNQRQAS